MALHPIMAEALAPFAPPARDIYRDFEISTHDWAGWQAIHVDYDGPEDNRAFTGKTRAEVVEAIDEWQEEQVDAPRYIATSTAAPGVYLVSDEQTGVIATIVAQREVADAFAQLLNDRPDLNARRSIGAA